MELVVPLPSSPRISTWRTLKETVFKFRGLHKRLASNTYRDIRRFLGCFVFEDAAGDDLAHLLVSIFKQGLLRSCLQSAVWSVKPSLIVGLRVSLKNFVSYPENEARVERAFGGLTAASGNTMKSLDLDLSSLVMSLKAKLRERRAQIDTSNIENWVGSDVWREMVLKSMHGLVFIHEHEDDPEFFTKSVHLMSNQFLSVIIYLNCFPGRCGGWELIDRADTVEQLARENHENLFTFTKHKTAKVYGPLKKWVPDSVVRALNATPRHATPRHATPRHATPRHATPRHATPRHATPRLASPRLASPRLAMPHSHRHRHRHRHRLESKRPCVNADMRHS